VASKVRLEGDVIEPAADELARPAPSPRAVAVSVERVSKQFTRNRETFSAVDDVSLELREGEFVCLVGRSGCGKTTLMNLVAGLGDPTSGSISLFGKRPVDLRGEIGYMFARDALYPWRTALDNVALGLEIAGVRRRERKARATEYLGLVGLGKELHSYPWQLSQGMRQRVAIARTLVTEPKILLMDEPFASVDAQTREMLQEAFLDLWDKHQRTVILVTHDLNEAIALGDRVVLIQDGRINHEVDVPFGRPRDLVNLRTQTDYHELYQELYVRIKHQQA
jgi:NitT/TauT family transport system ATP-binding protein